MSHASNKAKLEEILASDLSILDPKLLLIGRQVLTGFGKYIDRDVGRRIHATEPGA